MRSDSGLANNLKATRTRLGLSQQQLADAAKVTRQTIGGIEASAYAPSAAVALRLAHALGCRVEDLFWLESDMPSLTAHCPDDLPHTTRSKNPIPVALAQIQGRWIAYPLDGDSAFRTEMIPADGLATPSTPLHVAPLSQLLSEEEPVNAPIRAHNDTVMDVKLLDETENLARTAVLAGCTPILSLWARTAERWYPGLRVHWRFANSLEALQALAQGEVHAAGMHLHDPYTGVDNAAYVRQIMPHTTVALVHMGSWQEGLLVQPGNPKGIRGIEDLQRPDIRLINREPGSGARLLLDALMTRDALSTRSINGYDLTANSHLAVAQTIATGNADVGISVEAVANAFRLPFLPLQRSRYDLAIRETELTAQPVQQLLETLHHRWIRAQLTVLGGFDTTQTGEVTVIHPNKMP